MTLEGICVLFAHGSLVKADLCQALYNQGKKI